MASTIDTSTINDVIEYLQSSIDNFPSEIRHHLFEVRDKHDQIARTFLRFMRRPHIQLEAHLDIL